MVFSRPLSNGSWLVDISVEGIGSCRGVVGPNPYFLQTKGVSRDLVVLPLYYVFDDACGWGPRVYDEFSGLRGNITVCIEAPGGYGVASAMDWRGFGVDGSYRLPGFMFARYYLHDGIVVFDESRFGLIRGNGFSVVYQRGLGGGVLGYAVEAFRVARRGLLGVFGGSPRSPVVLVVVGGGVHPLYPPGFAHSMGGVVYVKVGGGVSWLVHTVAHECVHGWFNYGLLNGDFVFREAGAEFLALHSLRSNSTLYRLALRYYESMLEAGEGYALWAKLHEVLWREALRLCGVDVYSRALRVLFGEAVRKGGLYVDFYRFLRVYVEEAPVSCREGLAERLGVLGAAAGIRVGAGGASGAATLATTVTVTERVTVTSVRVSTSVVRVESCPLLPWLFIASLVALVSVSLLLPRVARRR